MIIPFLQSIINPRQALEESIAELTRVTPIADAVEMIEHLSDFAKLGYRADDLAMIIKAAERQEILAFEYGRVRRIGSSRTLKQIHEDGK